MMRWDEVPGFFDFQDVYELAMDNGGQMVEVGALFGRSAIYMAQRMKERNILGKLKVVDTFVTDEDQVFHSNIFAPGTDYQKIVEKHGSLYNAFKYYVRECGVGDKIIVAQCSSLEAAERMRGSELSFVFIDANHTYAAVRADIQAWLPLIKSGGYLAGHDYDSAIWPGVVQAVNENFRGRIEVLGKSWLVRV